MEPTDSDQSSLFENEPSREEEQTEQPGGALHLPSANELAPGQIPDLGLRGALRLVDEHAGNRADIVEAIRQAQFTKAAAKQSDPARRLEQQKTRANNVFVGLSEFGLASLSADALTDMGRELLATPDDETLYRRFAEHILHECYGIEVLRASRDIQKRQENPTKERLHRELELRGFHLKRDTTDHTQLRAWLSKAGVVKGPPNYSIDEERFAELAGVELDTLDELAGLTEAQIAYLRTLRRLAEATGTDELDAKTVRDHVELEHGIVIPHGQAAKTVIAPLADQGWLAPPEKKGGRGGKSGKVAPTDTLLELDLERFLSVTFDGVPADLRSRLNVPLETIRDDLESDHTYTRGIALELLALRLAYDLALRPTGFRLRSNATGGAEVDLIAEAVHLHHTRWLFQCKNTKQVNTRHVAEEAGMAGLLHAHVIVMVTTGRFSADATRYARALTASGKLQVVLVTGSDLGKYLHGGAGSIMKLFREAAATTARMKSDQIRPHRQQ